MFIPSSRSRAAATAARPRPGRGHALSGALAILLLCSLNATLSAQGSLSLSSGNTADNGVSGTTFICFEITATQPVNIHRFSSTFYTGTGTVEVWARPGGIVANDNTGWVFVNSASVTATSTTTEVIIPANLNYMINPGQTVGFAIVGNTIGSRYMSGVAPYIVSDTWLSIGTANGWSGNASTVPATNSVNFTWTNNPREWCGTVYYDPGIVSPDDAAILQLLSPVSFCAGQHDIKVKLSNLGTNALTSATINWSFNGVAQTPYQWTGNLASAASTDVTIGTKDFLSNVSYPLLVFSSSPNGQTDTRVTNDSLAATLKAAISGTLTIGGTSPDYPTLAAAVADITANGICGPVVFDVRPGTYNEQISIGAINGASSVNTITFQSSTGVRGDVTVTYAATGSTDNYVVMLSGAQYVTLRDMTFVPTGASYATAVDIRGGSSFCTLEGLDLVGVTTTSTSTNYAVVYSPSGSIDPDNTIRNCNVTNGSYGLYLYGSGTTSTEDNVTVQGCSFTGQYYRPVHFYYVGKLSFLDNSIVFNSAYTTKYVAYFNYGYDTRIERNTFVSDGGTYNYGVYFYYDNYYQTGSSRFVNNFVTSTGGTSTSYGVRPYNCYNLLFAHNTVVMNSTYATSYTVYNYSGSNVRYVNNIMAHLGAGRALYVSDPTAVIESDYNDMYVSGPVLAYWAGDRADLVALQTASGMDQNSISKPATYVNYVDGNLHLAAPSDDDDDMIGITLAEVTDDIDGDTRVRPYRGADEACYLIPNSLTYHFVDGAGNPTGYVEIPGTIGIHYTVIFPDFDANIQMTVNFYGITDNQLKYSATINDFKPAGQTLDNTQYLTLPSSLPVGFCRIEVVFNTKNSCGYYRNYMPYASSLMLINQGNIPCEVWPGDVNNDGVVNYTDRKDLNVYIHDANLRTLWLNGPARYRADAATNPMTYLAWQPQAGVPWFTTEGCYMDSDGNGVVNNFDYIAIKLNWMRTHGAISPKQDNIGSMTFDMSQNYPNPFNPSTTIRYSVPERSRVQLRIVDMLGRSVTTMVDGLVEAGTYTLSFDGSQLPSGQYLAIVSMTGTESGLGFEKTMKMTLAK